MSDTAETHDSPNYGFTREQWLTAVTDPHWFVATVAPLLVGALMAIRRGQAGSITSSDDALTEAKRLLDRRAEVRAEAGSAPVRLRDAGAVCADDCPRRHSADSVCICGRGRE